MKSIKYQLFVLLLLCIPTISLFAIELPFELPDSENSLVLINIGIIIAIVIIIYLLFRLLFKIKGSLILMLIASMIGFYLAFKYFEKIKPLINNEAISGYVVFYGIPTLCALLALIITALLRKKKV